MSRRSLAKSEGSSNPATKFLTWKSNEQSFTYYDKDKGENIKVELPLKVQFLEHFHTVKGWNDASESGIYSNEVQFISKEELSIKAFKGGELANGLYKDIRGRVKDVGGVYHRSIYCVDAEGNIINLSIKGAAVSAYSDFFNDNSNSLENTWLEIGCSDQKKKGSVKYYTPELTLGAKFSDVELKRADDKYNDIVDYFNKYSGEPQGEDEEDIDF